MEIATRYASLRTLTWAASLDGFIGKIGSCVALSGESSRWMTHQLRNLHDGILVGIGTVLNDDPSLTTRFIPPPHRHPRPIIVDPRAETPLDAKCMSRQPILLTLCDSPQHVLKGALVVQAIEKHGRIDIRASLDLLKPLGIHSVMIEGGASIIEQCIEWADVCILTVAPVFLGDGVKPCLNTRWSPHYYPLGDDMVLVHENL